jgi:hypothetical protein
MARFKAGLSLPDTSAFLHNQYIRKSPPSTPLSVSGLIGWWDFSDVGTLKQRVDGTVAVSSATDPIGYVTNKLNTTNQIGRFLRAEGDTGPAAATRPSYRTGGANGHSYAEFDGIRMYLQGKMSAGWGNVTGTDFSLANIPSRDRTRFIVCAPRNATYTNDKGLIEVWGKDAGATLENEALFIESSDDQVNLRTQGGQIVDSTENNTTAVQLWTWVAGVGAVSALYRNSDTSQGVDSVTVATTDSQDLTSGIYSIGALTDSLGVPLPGSQYEGSVYEILEFERTLSKPELEFIENYMKNKYSIS